MHPTLSNYAGVRGVNGRDSPGRDEGQERVAHAAMVANALPTARHAVRNDNAQRVRLGASA